MWPAVVDITQVRVGFYGRGESGSAQLLTIACVTSRGPRQELHQSRTNNISSYTEYVCMCTLPFIC